jgi:RNA polymerase sigma-70 factor, ECF subfamily
MNQGDFERNFREHHKAVEAYARAMCSRSDIAEEAVQETFLRAWKYLDSYNASGSFEGWLLRICRNCIVDMAHRHKLDEPWSDSYDQWVEEDRPHEIFDLLGSLPLAQREVLVVCGLLGYDYEGGAALLDIPIGTVRSRLSRARAAMAQLLGETQNEEQSETA